MQIEAKELRNTLKILSGVVQKDSMVPALSGVLLNKTSMTGGNSVLTIKLPFPNDLPECILEFETLYKMANNLNGLLEVKPGANAIEFKSLSGKISVPIIDGEKGYPVIAPENKHKEFQLTLDEVAEVNRLIPFTDAKSDRFMGIFYNGLYFAGTNGHCMGFYDKPTDKNISIIVYPEVYKALLPIAADFYTFKDGKVRAVKDDKVTAEISYLTIQMGMLPFDSVIPKNMPYLITGTHYDFKNLTNLLAISVNQRTNVAEFEFLPLTIIGRSKDAETNKLSEGQIEVESDGLEDALKIGLNLKLLETCINYLESETVSVNFEKPDKALILKGHDLAKKCLLMPHNL